MQQYCRRSSAIVATRSVQHVLADVRLLRLSANCFAHGCYEAKVGMLHEIRARTPLTFFVFRLVFAIAPPSFAF
jgi:hypothetical protein